jgi:hypothetical protein
MKRPDHIKLFSPTKEIFSSQLLLFIAFVTFLAHFATKNKINKCIEHLAFPWKTVWVIIS